MSVIITLVARKGGCGKTSLCIHLAGLLAAEELAVRLVDLDSQSSLSQFFLGSQAVERLAPAETVEACFGGAAPEAVEVKTKVDGVTLLPAHLKLNVGRDAELNLRSAGPDITLVDTPPDLNNPVVRAALLTSDFVLSPVDPEAFGAQSVLSVQQALQAVAIGFNPRLRLLGFVVNKRARLAVHGIIEDTLRRLHGDTVFEAVVPDLKDFKEAILAGLPITSYQPGGKAAAALSRLSEEVFRRIERAAKPKKEAA